MEQISRDMDTHNREPFEVFEKLVAGIAVIGLILLTLAYFAIPSFSSLGQDKVVFIQAVISNLVPTLLVFILAYAVLYRRIQKLRSEREAELLTKSIADEVSIRFRSTLGSLTNVIPSAEFAWLYRGNDLLRFESEIKTKEIWIVSPHLRNDTGTQFVATLGTNTITTVQKNLRRRISYTFIVPNTDTIQALLPQLRKNYGGYPDQLHVITLPTEAFDCLAFSEIAIYNPRMEGSHLPHVFLELRVAVDHAYWVELIDEVAYTIIARVQQIIDKNPVV